MARIPEHIINEIQDRCDIVEVISSYIPLRPAGRNFKALCPFHNEKTPSFIVSPDKQIYHCFGCNSGGNVFNFIKDYEKVDFIDAVKMMAEKTGVKLPEFKISKDIDNSVDASLYRINDITANYYSSLLLERPSLSSLARRYIEKRGLEEGVVKKFRIGYADPSWHSYTDYLSQRGIKLDIALKAGLILKGKDGAYYDLFRNRIIFPVFDVRGRILGFGGRVIDDSTPKYINSPETTVFKKGRNVYGLNFAKNSIRERGFAIISEGYLDVVTSHQYGIDNTVASLGTALTVEQIRLIRRYTHNVVMVYDADQAGEIATLRGLDLFLEEGMNVKIVRLERGHDPDSFIRKFGPRGFDAVIKKAENLFSYKLKLLLEKFDVEEPEGKARIVEEMLFTIRRVRNAVVRAEYIKRLANRLSIKEEAVWDELRKVNRVSARRRIEIQDVPGKTRFVIDISPAEKILVRLMLEDASVVNMVKESLKPFDFKSPAVRQLVEELFKMCSRDSSMDTKRLMNYLEDKVPPNIISFIVNEELEIKDRQRNISDCIRTIKKEKRDAMLKDIQERLVIAQKGGHKDKARQLLEEFNNILRRGL